MSSSTEVILHYAAITELCRVASEVRVFPLLALDGRRTLRVAAYIQALSDTSAKHITADLDLSGARRPLRESRRVNVDFPSWMVESLDREAKRLGVTRQPVIKIWIAERLERKVS